MLSNIFCCVGGNFHHFDSSFWQGQKEPCSVHCEINDWFDWQVLPPVSLSVSEHWSDVMSVRLSLRYCLCFSSAPGSSHTLHTVLTTGISPAYKLDSDSTLLLQLSLNTEVFEKVTMPRQRSHDMMSYNIGQNLGPRQVIFVSQYFLLTIFLANQIC